jgi:hypothetical protein
LRWAPAPTPAPDASAADDRAPASRRRRSADRPADQARRWQRSQLDAHDERRADQTMRRLVTVTMLLALHPFGVAVRSRRAEQLEAYDAWWAARLGLDASLDGFVGVAAVVHLVSLPVAWLLYRWLGHRRRRHTARLVTATLATRVYEPGRSRAWVWTLARVLVLFGALGALHVTGLLALGTVEDADPRWRGQPAWALVVLPAVAITLAVSVWEHRRHHEWPVVVGAGLAVRRPPPVVGATSFTTGLRIFGVNLLVTVVFALGALRAWFRAGRDTPFGELAATEVLLPLAYPGLAAVVLVVVLAVTRLRYMLRASFRRPSTRLAAGAMAVGTVVTLALSELSFDARTGSYVDLGTAGEAALVAGVVLVVAGVAVASVTGLHLQDVGPQPWLGILVLVTGFWVQLTTVDDRGQLAMAISRSEWVLVSFAAVFLTAKLVQHWRAWAGAPRPVPAPAPAAVEPQDPAPATTPSPPDAVSDRPPAPPAPPPPGPGSR